MVSATTLTFVLYGIATSVGVNAAPLSARSVIRELAKTIPGLQQFGISQGCQDTLTSMLNSPASACLNIPGTAAILSTVPGSSWIAPTNTWLSDFCAADTCTSSEISQTVSTAADACAAEIARFGVTKEFVMEQAVNYYPSAKQAVCLRDANNSNDLCAITALQSLEVSLGGQPLTPEVVQANYEVLLANNFMLARELSCTQCASAGFALLRPMLPQQFMSTIDSFVGDQCGADFQSTPTNGLSVVTGSAAFLAAQATAAPSVQSSAMLSVRSAMTTTGIVGILATLVALF